MKRFQQKSRVDSGTVTKLNLRPPQPTAAPQQRGVTLQLAGSKSTSHSLLVIISIQASKKRFRRSRGSLPLSAPTGWNSHNCWLLWCSYSVWTLLLLLCLFLGRFVWCGGSQRHIKRCSSSCCWDLMKEDTTGSPGRPTCKDATWS